MKKLLIILGLVVVLGGGAAYYFLYYSSPSDELVEPADTLTAISPENVISPVANNSNPPSAIWYGLPDARLMRLDLAKGQSSEYALPPVMGGNFRNLFWPASGSDFLAQSDLGGQRTFSYFDEQEKKYYMLPTNVLSLDWLNDSVRVAMVWKGGDGQVSLVVSNADGTGYRIVRSLPWEDLVVKASPAANTALLFRQPATTEVSKVYLFDLQTGEYTEPVAEGKNTAAMWSPTGNHFAFTRLEETGSELYIYDMLTKQERSLGLRTGINRVAFTPDGTRLFVAATSATGQDEVWSVDASTGEKSLLYEADFGIKARSLFLVGQKVYFVGADDGRIHTVQ